MGPRTSSESGRWTPYVPWRLRLVPTLPSSCPQSRRCAGGMLRESAWVSGRAPPLMRRPSITRARRDGLRAPHVCGAPVQIMARHRMAPHAAFVRVASRLVAPEPPCVSDADDWESSGAFLAEEHLGAKPRTHTPDRLALERAMGSAMGSEEYGAPAAAVPGRATLLPLLLHLRGVPPSHRGCASTPLLQTQGRPAWA